MSRQHTFIDWFRHSSPYIHAHRDKTVVLMLSGEAVDSDNFPNIVSDIALLNSLGIRLILVHGARSQIDRRLDEAGIEIRLHHDQRVTDSKSFKCVIEAVGQVRTSLEAQLSMGLANTPMHGAQIRVSSGNFITAKPLGVLDGIDMGHTGELRKVDRIAIIDQLNLDNIVLISNLGYSPTGEVFNLPVEEVAVGIASAVGADKLILFGSQEGIYDSQGELRTELLATTARRLVNHYLAKHDDPSLPYTEASNLLAAAAHACDLGVPRCHLVSYLVDGALLTELFTRDGTGTMVSREPYEEVREATVEDIGGILEMIAPLEERGVLVRRSRELLESELEQFLVVVRDSVIIGCAALYPFTSERAGELACVAISGDYRGGKRGDLLLDHIEERARSLGLEQLFVLTTRTAHWFQERGFEQKSLDNLPNERQALYNFQRNSKVFFKQLV